MRAMRTFAVLAAAVLMLGFVLPALAQGTGAPTPQSPSAPGSGQGAPGYGPGPGGPGYGPGSGPARPGMFGPRGPRGVGPGVHRGGPLFWGFMLLRLLFFVGLILVFVGLILVLWRLLTARELWGRLDPAMQILRGRYARGEISEEEYRKRLGTLA